MVIAHCEWMPEGAGVYMYMYLQGSIFQSTLHHCGSVSLFTISHKQSSEICKSSLGPFVDKIIFQVADGDKECRLPVEKVGSKTLTSNSPRSMAKEPFSVISSLCSSCTTDVIVAMASLIFLKTPSLLPLADLESGCLRQVCNKKVTITNTVRRLSTATCTMTLNKIFPYPIASLT